jgi:monofunctional glycosyltransferase
MFRILRKIIFYFFISTISIVVLYRFIPVYITPLVIIRYIEGIENKENGAWQKTWVPREDISVNCSKAVVSAEDQHFFEHSGFDFDAIQKAYTYNQHKPKNKPKRGASTISQQTAKNVFLWQGRSYLRKALEFYFTVLIELIWNKERILEVYLNVIEMGKGVYGVEAFAHENFKISAKELNKKQAASMAAILPNPLKWSASNPNQYIKQRTNKIMFLMQKNNVNSTVKYE